MTIYKIIVKRFLSIFYPPAEFNKVSITINIENEIFTTSKKVCTKQGYLEIAKSDVAAEIQNNENTVGAGLLMHTDSVRSQASTESCVDLPEKQNILGRSRPTPTKSGRK